MNHLELYQNLHLWFAVKDGKFYGGEGCFHKGIHYAIEDGYFWRTEEEAYDTIPCMWQLRDTGCEVVKIRVSDYYPFDGTSFNINDGKLMLCKELDVEELIKKFS